MLIPQPSFMSWNYLRSNWLFPSQTFLFILFVWRAEFELSGAQSDTLSSTRLSSCFKLFYFNTWSEWLQIKNSSSYLSSRNHLKGNFCSVLCTLLILRKFLSIFQMSIWVATHSFIRNCMLFSAEFQWKLGWCNDN